MARINLHDLPSEVVHQILLLIEPTFLPTLELVSKQFSEFANQPLLWQHHCRDQFKYWNAVRNMQERFASNVADTDWKELYSERYRIDRDVTRRINSILASQTGRIQKSAEIVDFGHEAKDTLISHCNIDDDADDVLARRHYSRAVLRSVHRSLAIQQWKKLQSNRHVPLETALSAFDMFISCDEEVEFDTISASLDSIAKEVHQECPGLNDQTSRQQAVQVTNALRRKGFRGVRHTAHYHDLSNNFIGMALRDEEHQALPIVQAAIYCCVAQRIGLDAHPCGFPRHVHVIIKSPSGRDLDGRIGSPNTESPAMYIDPWRSSEETPKEDLIMRLRTLKVTPSNFEALLGPSSTAEIIRRTARNIVTSVEMLPQIMGVGGHSNFPSTSPSAKDAFYGALWALLLLPEGEGDQIRAQQERYIPYMLRYVEQDFLLDLGLFQKNALTYFQEQYHYEQLRGKVFQMVADDNSPKKRKARRAKRHESVRYKVGQVFRHKRYHYSAIITGWDVECEATEAWIAQMNVRSLPGGQHQAFYHVMVEDQSVRYVAEENIQVVTPNAVTPGLMAIAGQHFKRWDRTAKCFVSNVRDEYPDD